MHRRRGKIGKQPLGGPTARLLTLSPCHLVTLSLLWLVGCSAPKNLPAGDPLLGGGPPLPKTPGKAGPAATQGTAGTANGTTGTPQASTVPPVPTTPASGTGFSPAALASGRPSPFDRSRDLQINDGPRPPQGSGWATPTGVSPSNGSGVMLRPPEPVSNPSSLPGAITPPAPPPGPSFAPGSASTTLEQVQAQLQARGVLWQKPEAIAGGDWKFTCAIRHPQHPNQQRTYQAQGRDLLEAMQAVLQRMDGDLRRTN
jgi:hypothetical protein